jgi:hypothetical protein
MESRLKCVVGIVRVAEDAPADAEHHRAVAAYQGFKGDVIAPGEIAFEQRAVAALGAAEHAAAQAS